MLILENIKLALNGLKMNKMRSFLTMLGIIIGIGSVIAIMTVSSSLTSSITNVFSEMGANNITIGLQQKSEEEETRQNGMKFGSFHKNISLDQDERITDQMIEITKNQFSTKVDAIALEENLGSGTLQAEAGDESANISLSAINEGYYKTNKVSLVCGRFLTKADIEGDKHVIMVSDKVIDNIFNGDSQLALSQKLTLNINNQYYDFYIVGVYEYETDASSFSSETEENISTTAYIPITTGKKLLHLDEGYDRFTIVTNSQTTEPSEFATEIEEYMNTEFYRTNSDYQIQAITMSSMTNSMKDTINMVSIAIAFIAGISLLVGGIGVMNIMLVSITERTREIGTRKALGAKNSSIRLQFIIEAMVLCFIGGILGIVVGFLLGAIAVSMLGCQATAPVAVIIGSVAFSMAIGVFFGYYPANKAAKMEPIEALRYE